MTTIVKVHPSTIKVNRDSMRIYSDAPSNYETIKENIRYIGILQPLIVNEEDNVVVSGNIRLRIAMELGLDEIPVIYTNDTSMCPKLLAVSHGQQRIKTYSEIIREREILELYFPIGKGSRTDIDPVKKRNKEILKSVDFGISTSKMDLLKSLKSLIEELYSNNPEEKKKIWEEIDSEKNSLRNIYNRLSKIAQNRRNIAVLPQKVNYKNELFQIINDSNVRMRELEKQSISCIYTSPPYFQMRDYGTGKNQRGLERSIDEYIKGLADDFEYAKDILKEDGSLWVNINEGVFEGQYNGIPHRFVMEMMKRGWIFNDEWVWIKPNPLFNMHNRSVRSHEYIFHFVKNEKFYYDKSWLTNVDDSENNISIGTQQAVANIKSSVDFRDNVISIHNNNMDKLRYACIEKGFYLTHTAGFPISIPMISILMTSKEGDLVLDPYSGTASTGEAALIAGRRYIGYEINNEYALSSLVRLERFHDLNISEILKAA